VRPCQRRRCHGQAAGEGARPGAPVHLHLIADQIDVTQQAVSQHLQVLRDAGLVAVRRDGTRRLYAIRPEGFASLEHFLAGLWPAGIDRLKAAGKAEEE
jgi:DNA-binding transcriptional ArsR family regulator